MEILWYYHIPNRNVVNERVETLKLSRGHIGKTTNNQCNRGCLYFCGVMGTTVPLLTVFLQ